MEKEEEEIITTMQSSTAMQQSCTCAQSNCFFPVQNNCFFPVNTEEKENKEKRRRWRRRTRRRRWRRRTRRRRSQLQCNLPQQWNRVVLVGQGNCFFPVNKEEKEKGEDKNKQQKEDKIKTTMQSSVATQQICTRGPRQSFLFSKQGGEGGKGKGGGG